LHQLLPRRKVWRCFVCLVGGKHTVDMSAVTAPCPYCNQQGSLLHAALAKGSPHSAWCFGKGYTQPVTAFKPAACRKAGSSLCAPCAWALGRAYYAISAAQVCGALWMHV
jgi:hypothetical protein